MFETIIGLVVLLSIPAVLWCIEAYISINTKGRSYKFDGATHKDYTILIPIYGQIKYLETVEYLKQYGNRVMLLTTGGESQEFMDDISAITKQHNFKLFIADWSGKQDLNKRATSGTIRDRLIRDAIQQVTTEYVVPLDADSITKELIDVAVGELHAGNADIASIRLIPSNGDVNWLTKLQKLEYRVAMDMRVLVPWLISGACQIAKTEVMKEIMSKHSLFFQGNDVEIGLLAKRLGYTVVHIPFEVHTALPSTVKAWYRQRLAWAGGEFRLFIVNFFQILHHPFFWFYGAIITIATFPLRYWAIANAGQSLFLIFGLYIWLIFFMHWKFRNVSLGLMPLYTLVSSLIFVPLGVYMYFYMAIKDRNTGYISVKRPTTASKN